MTKLKAATEIRQIETDIDLSAAFDSGLIEVFQQCFALPPYYQYHSNNDIREYFEEYRVEGILYLSWRTQEVVGFTASLPLIKASIFKAGMILQGIPGSFGAEFLRDRSNIWQIIEVKTGDSVIAQQNDRAYEIRLACLKAVPGDESRKVLQTNLDNGNISIYQIGVAQPQKNAPDRISAEVFVDLGDGPQSLNEAQLMGGVAIIHEKASQANCPRLETMKQAQAEARESKSGAWEN